MKNTVLTITFVALAALGTKTASAENEALSRKTTLTIAGATAIGVPLIMGTTLTLLDGWHEHTLYDTLKASSAFYLVATPLLVLSREDNRKIRDHVFLMGGALLGASVASVGVMIWVGADNVERHPEAYTESSVIEGIDTQKKAGLITAGAGLALTGLMATLWFADDTDYGLRVSAAPSATGTSIGLSGNF